MFDKGPLCQPCAVSLLGFLVALSQGDKNSGNEGVLAPELVCRDSGRSGAKFRYLTFSVSCGIINESRRASPLGVFFCSLPFCRFFFVAH